MKRILPLIRDVLFVAILPPLCFLFDPILFSDDLSDIERPAFFLAPATYATVGVHPGQVNRATANHRISSGVTRKEQGFQTDTNGLGSPSLEHTEFHTDHHSHQDVCEW